MNLPAIAFTLGLSLITPALADDVHAQAHDEHEHESDHREHGAHVHGEGKMTLAIEGSTVEILFESPAESIFGFEHAPTDSTEKATLEKALRRLSTPDTLFDFGKKAGCKNSMQQVTSPFADANKSAEHHSHAEHADIDAEYTFICTHPGDIKTIDVQLFVAFPALHSITLDYVTEKSQGSKVLNPEHHQLEVP